MPPNPNQKIISLAILALLVFQPLSFIFAEETANENQSLVLVEFICDNNNCVGEIIAQITEDIVGVFPFIYDNAPFTKKTKNIYAFDRLVSTIETTGSTITPYYILTDHLNSTNVVTDTAGNITELLDYYPYGSIRLDTGSFKEQRKYIGEEFDTNTNLSYLNARYYSSSRGQFISEDPVFWEIGQTEDGKKVLLNPQSQNTYSYSNNNPITNSDPSGRCVWDFCIAEATIIAGTLAMYAPQITSFAQSLMTPLGQYGMSQAVEDAHKGNYGWAVFGAVTAGEIPSGRAARNLTKYGDELGSKINNLLKSTAQTGLDLTNHAALRMMEKRISIDQVVKTIENNKPIEYFHDGAWKNGFRDQVSKIFVGQEKNSGRITTVIDKTSSNYLSNLISKGQEALSKLKR